MTTFSPSAEIEFDVHISDHPRPRAERERLLAAPGFGAVFTDHMVTIRWTAERGWHDARLEPYGPLTLDPATQVFHYAQEIFEGLKAYRQAGGSVAIFRPWANAARFNSSARRMAMPELPEETFVRAIELLVAQDRAWVSDTAEHSLYLRPFMIATQVGLGINRPSQSYQFTAHRLARRGLLPERDQAGHRLAVAGVHPRRTRRYRRDQVRRQLRRLVRRPAAGRSTTAATRSSGWTPRNAAGSRRWAA